MSSTVKAIKSESLSKFYEDRYILVDIETGELIDDAQGYGFRTAKGAYQAYAYHNRDKSDELDIHKFLKENHKIIDYFYDECFYDLKDNDKRKPELILEGVLNELNIKTNFNIKKIYWGIKHYDKIEKDLRKNKYK